MLIPDLPSLTMGIADPVILDPASDYSEEEVVVTTGSVNVKLSLFLTSKPVNRKELCLSSVCRITSQGLGIKAEVDGLVMRQRCIARGEGVYSSCGLVGRLSLCRRSPVA